MYIRNSTDTEDLEMENSSISSDLTNGSDSNDGCTSSCHKSDELLNYKLCSKTFSSLMKGK